MKTYDPRKNTVNLGVLEIVTLQEKLQLLDIRCHTVVQTSSLFYFLHAKYGSTILSISTFDPATSKSTDITTDYKDMHSFDFIECKLASTSTASQPLLECVFAGRTIKVVSVTLPTPSAPSPQKAEVSVREEYLGFRNTRFLRILWNDRWILGVGEGFNAGVQQSSTINEASGILLYGRNLGPFLLQGIDKKQLFDQLLANDFQLELDGSDLYLHAGVWRFVLHYKLAEATLSSTTGLRELPTLVVSPMPGEERQLPLNNKIVPDPEKVRKAIGHGIFRLLLHCLDRNRGHRRSGILAPSETGEETEDG
jgi:hypothetical protein